MLFQKRSRRGSATVEFALAAPLLFALAFGLIEGGRVVFILNQMSNAAREGCRVAALSNVLDSNDVVSTIESHMESTGLDNLEISVSPASLSTVQPGNPVTVTLSVKYRDASWVPIADIVGDASIRIEKRVVREGGWGI